jgi:hypothetical protein
MYSDRISLIKKLRVILPPVFTRQYAAQITGNIFTSATLRNLNSQNRGPTTKIKIGKKVCYDRDNFLDWFSNYLIFENNLNNRINTTHYNDSNQIYNANVSQIEILKNIVVMVNYY